MAEFVGPVAEVGKCIAEPIQRQFNYLCCFNTNIQNLRDEAQRLDDAKQGVDRQVEADRCNAQVIVPRVETWQADASKIQEDMSGVETEILNVKSGCLAIKSRFSLSRKAKKMTVAMKELQDDCGTFGQISHPPPPAAMASIPLAQVYELKSRKDFEEEVMETLREKKVSSMGLYGMGGVGKTTMAKNIMTRAREEGLFDEIVFTVVSQPVDMLKIQEEMADFLGLNLGVNSLLARAHLLHVRLMNSKKSILIILDDLWEGLILEDLGIPKECTILLTSRNSGVFSAMNVEKKFQVKTLDDVEAWSLFKETVGACADDQSLFPIAQEIVQECKGLPIAIVTVGVALKDEMNKYIWEDAVHELRSSNPQDIPKFLSDVYNPLKLSYDLLPSKPEKSIFLLCCLFPEDYNIPISDLCLYAWGLGIFVGIRRLQDARNKMQTLIGKLISRSLLLDVKYEGSVKMHDVVRDVGIFIATKEGLMWAREGSNNTIDCSWISLFGADKITLPEESVVPNLRFLFIKGPTHNQKKLCDNLFESSRNLSVLSILFDRGMRSLPHTIQLQQNMRTLILDNCQSLVDISIVGELVSLEILRCHDCYEVKELPVEIGRLNQLKLLDISDCWKLKTIKAGVISKLIRLEELTLIKSFKKWELAVEEGKSAAVCELNFLTNLTTLKIHIKDVSSVAEQIHLPNLVEFDITIGSGYVKYSGFELMFRPYKLSRYRRRMRLELKGDVIIGDWIHQLLRSTKGLVLNGEGSSKLLPFLPQCQSLKELTIRTARMITGLSDGTTTVFPLLENLHLEDIDDLEEIHKGSISSDSFNNLSSIKIVMCRSLRNVLPLAMGNNLVLLLKSLEIKSCRMLEQVWLCNKEESAQSSCITFPNLEQLMLQGLPRVTTLCKGIDSIEFPALTQVSIKDCSNMKSLVSSTKNDHKKCSDDDSLHLFCRPAALGRLKELTINGSLNISRLWCDQIPIEFFTKLEVLKVECCDNIKSLFSPFMARNLVNLRELTIKSCFEIVKVIEDKDENELMNRCITFPRLDKLLLCDLPRLTYLCKGIQSIEFPLLTEIEIKNCPNMKNLVSTAGNETKCSGAINRDTDDSLHLFCKSEVAFDKLKNLRIGGYGSISSERSLSLWCHQIPFGFFNRLVLLMVYNFGNTKSLFSPSIAENLINLRWLTIESCGEMVKVIEGDEDKSSLYINLEVLELIKLPKLKTFCDWRCSIYMPSLGLVVIKECPEMERFSFGSLTTPNLKVISKNGKRLSDYTKDLNEALRRDFLHPDILFDQLLAEE